MPLRGLDAMIARVMRWSVGSGLIWLGLVLGCARATPAKEPGPTPRTPLLETAKAELQAERISAEFALLGVPVGDVTVRVCPRNGVRATTIDTEMQAASLIRAVRRVGGNAHTTLAPDDVSPQRTEIAIYDGDKTRTYRVTYQPGSYEYEYTKTGDDEPRRGRKAPDTPGVIHDVHSAFLLLRGWKPRLDEQAHFLVVLGRHLYRVEARSAGRKVVLIQGAPRVTTRIDGEARRVGQPGSSSTEGVHRTFSLWFEDGAGSVPVRLTATTSFGELTMTLARHERPAQICGPPRVSQ